MSYYVKAQILRTEDLADNHIACCKTRFALCGAELLTGPEGDCDGEPLDCRSCVIIDEAGVPCGARFCRLRSWWRERRP